MYAIYVPNLNKYFLKDHSKVIVFDTIEEANNFAGSFYNWAMAQAANMMMDGDPSVIGEVMTARSYTRIEPLPENHSMETINFKDLKK